MLISAGLNDIENMCMYSNSFCSTSFNAGKLTSIAHVSDSGHTGISWYNSANARLSLACSQEVTEA